MSSGDSALYVSIDRNVLIASSSLHFTIILSPPAESLLHEWNIEKEYFIHSSIHRPTFLTSDLYSEVVYCLFIMVRKKWGFFYL